MAPKNPILIIEAPIVGFWAALRDKGSWRFGALGYRV